MLFNSLTFLAFFGVILIIHRLPLSWTIKKVNLLIASYVFYAAWNPPFVILLIVAAVVDFSLARWIGRTESPAGRRFILCLSLLINLGLLGYFKYGTFMLANLGWVGAWFGIRYDRVGSSIILPLGISFYTFETISYLVDVYRKRVAPWHSFLDYALFLTFFPHLVAGPIVRSYDFLPQCAEPRRATAGQMGWGLSLLVVGLFQKIILADRLLAPVADHLFDSPGQGTFLDAWAGTMAFSGQIFFDFAGYSSCGIGAALCLGFVLNDNFHYPYAAVGFSDFWRRWHMSLSSWLRDYLYVSLGGNRKGNLRTYLNLMITMLLGGLWHGASWRFVAWGGLHGSFLMIERFLKTHLGRLVPATSRLIQIALALLTFVVVSMAWVFFRATSFSEAFHVLGQMCRPSGHLGLVSHVHLAAVATVMSAVLIWQWRQRESNLEQVVGRLSWPVRALALSSMLIVMALSGGDDRAFIYFQF
jgi:alginate O-acetyltransferase complex protein AlgI